LPYCAIITPDMDDKHDRPEGDVEIHVPPATTKEKETSPEEQRRQRRIVIGAIAAGVLLLAVVIAAIVLLLQPGTDTAKIRDVFIIVMAVESLVIGLALIILILQMAKLINLLQNEIKPILDSTQETVNTLRGTTAFLSDNLVEPVVKLNEYLAALRSMFGLVRLSRRK